MTLFSERLRKQLRRYEKARLLRRLAKTAGVDVTTIYAFMDGKREVTMKTAEKLCEAMQIDIVLKRRDAEREWAILRR